MNKKSLVTIVVVALVLTTLALPSNALAGNIFKFRGRSADAFFSSTDQSGCIVTDVGVFASENTFHNPPGRGDSSSEASLFISQYDICTETQLLAADGFSSLADEDFQVVRRLNGATLEATITVFDYVSETSVDVFVDLTWTGSGPLSRQNDHFRFQSPGCMVNGRFNGSFRSAEVSGTVSDGVTDYTPESGGGSIQSARSGEVTVGCGV